MGVAPERCVGLTNGLALTPPMGWNSWNRFTGAINEQLIQQMADAMATNGMKAVGYQYVNIDDCWSVGNDTNGLPLVDTNKFPSGMKALGDYIHAKGLKFGLYTRRGTPSCGYCTPFAMDWNLTGYADKLASWGMDYLKVDLSAGTNSYKTDYTLIGNALAGCGRPVVYSICTGCFESWMPDCGNLWRTTQDISFDFPSIVSNLDVNNTVAWAGGPGHWNDPDMLQVGNGALTDDENRSHFTMWCIAAAPLIAGNDLRSMSGNIGGILTAPEVIAVDQDAAGVQGTRVSSVVGSGGNLEVWSKPLGTQGSSKAVALFNRSTNQSNITVYWTNINLSSGPALVRDLWARTNLGSFTNSFSASVAPHGVVMVKITQATALRIGLVPPGQHCFLISGSLGVPRAQFYVLFTTNPMQPLDQWLRVATNFCDTNGNFAFTNTPGAPRGFYVVQVP